MVEHELLVERLDYYYNLVTLQILQHQSLTHGLFPLKIDNEDDKEGHVRDNIYCAMCIWTLSLAYRHVDNNGGRKHELERSAVKCMRGILFFYMRQADKVEAFKKDQQPVNAIHCKFNINTADVSKDDTCHKLQMDAVALYVIVLCQMIASGLYIIFTMDEVHFIQNLVYYIERTYRTADFGMWGRGTRYNTGQPELNASSIGMVKAALEAINGFNLFGKKGTQSSVVYVDSDAHYRNKSTLYSLLPRESNSKKSDAALLAVTGYPAFAIDDTKLRNETKETVISELKGKCGFKRFHCDGFGSDLEHPTKPYYEKGELMVYESIENEWPLFYIYLALDAIFQGDLSGGGYMEQIEKLMAYTKYGKTLPMFYYVAQRDIEAEKRNPGEVVRWPNENMEEHFLWGQSLYLIAMMLVERLITCEEIDPIGRSIYGKSGRAVTTTYINPRYSSFKVCSQDLVIQVCLIAENRSLQANLLTYGIETQTPKEIEPIVICPPHDLVQVYEDCGTNKKLKLSGRPLRPMGGLGTSKIYKILGKTVVTYPSIFDARDFYMAFDMCLLIEDLKTCLAFIRRSWNMSGRPTVCFFLRDHNFRGLHSTAMVDFMAELKTGYIDGVNIKLGKLQCLVGGACVEHLDYLREKECSKINIITGDEKLQLSGPCGFESVQHPILMTSNGDEAGYMEIDHLQHLSTPEIVSRLRDTNSLVGKMLLLQVVMQRDGPAYPIDDLSVEDYINDLYSKACFVRNWSVVRQGASLLGKSVASMAPCITSMLVCGKQVVLGLFGKQGYIISEPLTTDAIKDIIFQLCMAYDPREVSLQQEMVVYLGNVVNTKPQLFQGMLKIRVGWIIEVMKTQLESGYKLSEDASHPLSIYDLYPNEVQQLLIAVLSGGGKIRGYDVTPRNMREKRTLEGGLNRVPSGLYESVWAILKCISGGIRVKGYHIPQQPTLNEMTADEFKFKLVVEDMIQEATLPVERQIIVEVIMVISTIVSRNSELLIEHTIDLNHIIESAIDLFIKEDLSRTKDDFYHLPCREKSGSVVYLTRSFVNNVLHESTVLGESDANCCIS